MSKYTKAEKERKVEEARRLYVKGFDLDAIARFVDVSMDTLRKWVREHDFEASRKTNIIQRPEIIEALLQSFQSVLNGETPRIRPLDAAQYASAFEKLSDKKKLLSFTMEAYELLTDEMIAAIEKGNGEKAKKDLFAMVKEVRYYMDRVVGRLSQEVLHE